MGYICLFVLILLYLRDRELRKVRGGGRIACASSSWEHVKVFWREENWRVRQKEKLGLEGRDGQEVCEGSDERN